MTDLDKRLAALTPEQQARLRQRLAEKQATAPTSRIVPQPRGAILPLSFAQERLWFLEQFEPGSAAYHIPTLMRLRGPLDHAALEQGLAEIVRRHEALRTTFTATDGHPAQHIQPDLTVPLHYHDLRPLPASVREAEAQQFLHAASASPFDLERGPLARWYLVQVADEEHLFLLLLHHIIADGWSLGVLTTELATLYRASCTGASSTLSPLPIQYVDYAIWQRQRLEAGGVLAAQLAYWQQHLAGLPPRLELPTDRPRPARQTFNGGATRAIFPGALHQALLALGRKEGTTLFMTLLAALHLLFHRLSGQEEIALGTTIAGRTQQETEGLIGFFVNTLVLRGTLTGNPTFRTLLAQARDRALDAFANQEVPFAKLVETLAPERNLSHSPLFQVMFMLQNAPADELDLAGVTMERVPLGGGTAKFELTLAISERDGGLRVEVEYNSDLFDLPTVERLLGHFRTLLEAIVANPDQRVGDLPLLNQAERHLLLHTWNATRRPVTSLPVHEQIAAQAARTPDAVALRVSDETWSYRALNERANQLAHYLQALGIGPEVRVGLSATRGAEMVVGLLAILKAGGAYVPLDPTYPAARLAAILEDARAPFVLTQRTAQESLPPDAARLVLLEGDEWATQPRHDPPTQATGDTLAYVIFTSGSTGRPKGVQVTHAALANFLASMRETPGISAQDVLVAVTTIAFDIAGLELWLPLTVGAQVVVASREEAADPHALAALLTRTGASLLQATPATWRMLVESGWAGSPTLTLLCGGEALPVPLAAALRARGKALWNLYGPTETTIWSTLALITGAEVTMGRPIANTELFLLDRYGQPVPIGTPGELLIGGRGLARGYEGRPDLTAERFVPHPFSTEPGARLYRTGDLARWLPDGQMEFLGRLDQQVKLRGFRIELGEIEATLARHPAIQQAVVVPRPVSGEPALVAYLVLHENQSLTLGELRPFLASHLPDYMLPAAVVPLDTFPLTPNGKVDRRALPDPSGAALPAAAFVAPSTPVEETLAGIWQAVLGRERIGIHDNFFDLGGYSLMATQILARVGVAFGLTLPLRALFEAPTLAQLAALIEEIILAEIEALDEEEAERQLTPTPRDPS